MPAVAPPLPAPPAPFRRTTLVLLGLGLSQLAVWLGACLHTFYTGSGLILLPVHAGRALGATRVHLSTMLPTAVGTYSTGLRGELLYHATALSDYLLFYRIGSLTAFDALFLAGLGGYLHYTVGRLPASRTFTLAASRTLNYLALATLLLHVLRMAFLSLATQVFKAKAHGLFQLATTDSTLFYLVAGMLLGLCATAFQQGQRLLPAAPLPDQAGAAQ